jgi:hypothetical protein
MERVIQWHMVMPPPKLISFTPIEKRADRPAQTAKRTFLKVSLIRHIVPGLYIFNSHLMAGCGVDWNILQCSLSVYTIHIQRMQ